MHFVKAWAGILVMVTLYGCSRPGDWLKGKWVLDKDLTRQKMEEQAAGTSTKTDGLGGMMKDLASSMAAPMLLSMLQEAQIEFTGEEMITTINGSGQATAYEVMETPDKNTAVIKKADGEVQTYRHEGAHIVTTSPGPMAMPIYLRRVP